MYDTFLEDEHIGFQEIEPVNNLHKFDSQDLFLENSNEVADDVT